ncbi:MAG: hypothetical protein PHP83_02255 [Clostridia bacterium]|nr:hypothetical protein [Clostridia bacterium]
MKDLSKRIELYCPICGCSDFSSLDIETKELLNADDSSKVQCANCKKIFKISEILDSNQEIINSNIEKIQNEALLEIEKQLKRTFNKR